MLAETDVGQAERILDAALFLGEQRGWDAVHMYDIADYMQLGLADLQRHFRHKDDLAELWFRRADAAIVRSPAAPGWMELSVRQRLSRAIRAWFAALEPHKAISREMLLYKVQPDHIHLVVQGVLRTSATVQWVREAARLPSTGLRRELEEPALTAIFLGTLALWLVERSPGTPRAFAWLEGSLAAAERMALSLEATR